MTYWIIEVLCEVSYVEELKTDNVEESLVDVSGVVRDFVCQTRDDEQLHEFDAGHFTQKLIDFVHCAERNTIVNTVLA